MKLPVQLTGKQGMAAGLSRLSRGLAAGREGVRCLSRPGQSVLARCVPRVHHEEVPDVAPQP